MNKIAIPSSLGLKKGLRRFTVPLFCSYKYTKSMFQWQILINFIFSVSLKFQACYITSQWGEFSVKNALLRLHIHAVFHQKICVFIILFFWWSIKFPQQNINQSETEISDKKLSVELYAIYSRTLACGCNFDYSHQNCMACYSHVTYEFQSESKLCICLNVREILAWNRCQIWRLSDSNEIRTHLTSLENI